MLAYAGGAGRVTCHLIVQQSRPPIALYLTLSL